jgi:hypothetical protein
MRIRLGNMGAGLASVMVPEMVNFARALARHQPAITGWAPAITFQPTRNFRNVPDGAIRAKTEDKFVREAQKRAVIWITQRVAMH